MPIATATLVPYLPHEQALTSWFPHASLVTLHCHLLYTLLQVGPNYQASVCRIGSLSSTMATGATACQADILQNLHE